MTVGKDALSFEELKKIQKSQKGGDKKISNSSKNSKELERAEIIEKRTLRNKELAKIYSREKLLKSLNLEQRNNKQRNKEEILDSFKRAISKKRIPSKQKIKQKDTAKKVLEEKTLQQLAKSERFQEAQQKLAQMAAAAASINCA